MRLFVRGGWRVTRRCCKGAARAVGWLSPVAPAALVIAMPKCPACVAGWVALVTGVGVSTGAATAVRYGVFAALGASLVVVGLMGFAKIRR